MRSLALVLVLVGAGCTAIVDAGSYSVGGGTCDSVSGSGCDTGQACFTRIATGDAMCIDEGTRSSGRVCTGMGQCVSGATCIFFTPDRGLCTDYCRTDGDCSDIPGSIGCNLNSDTGIGSCFQGCDPSDAASCGAGVACFAMGTAGACVATGPNGLDDPCGFSYDDACQQGFVCLMNTEGANACFAQCGPGLPDCPSGQTCTFALGSEIRPAEAGEWGACST